MAALKIRSFLPAKTTGDVRTDPAAAMRPSINRLGFVVEDIGHIIAKMHMDKLQWLDDQKDARKLKKDQEKESKIEQQVEKEVEVEVWGSRPPELRALWPAKAQRPSMFWWAARSLAPVSGGVTGFSCWAGSTSFTVPSTRTAARSLCVVMTPRKRLLMADSGSKIQQRSGRFARSQRPPLEMPPDLLSWVLL